MPDIEQNQASGFKGSAAGANTANFSQTTNQMAIANTPNGKTVNQTQNANDGDGITRPSAESSGRSTRTARVKSTAAVTQDETQCEDAANDARSSPTALTGRAPLRATR